jgi:hypothetical protein
MTYFQKLCNNMFILENKIDAQVFRRTCVNLCYILLKIALICVNLERFPSSGSLENGPGLLEERIYINPIFWSLPLHLEVLNLPFLIEIGDFTFFQILFFLNLDYT